MLSSSSSHIVYTVVVIDGLVSVNLTFGDEVLALAANEYLKLWLRRGLVEQLQPALYSRLEMKPPTAPPWLHPMIQVAYGWFEFHDGSQVLEVAWVPWSALRGAEVAEKGTEVRRMWQHGEEWSVTCSSHDNAVSIQGSSMVAVNSRLRTCGYMSA
jgi:hypothetical protein